MNHRQLLLTFSLMSFFNPTILADEEAIDYTDQQTVQIINGQIIIELDEQNQKNAGIKTQRVKATPFQKELIVYGKAIDIAPLLKIGSQYQSILSKQAGAKARLLKAETTINRLRNLHKNKAVSTSKLQTQQSQWQSDKAIFDELSYQGKIIISQSKLQWGDTLTNWFINKNSTQLKQLSERKITLLTVALSAGTAPINQMNPIVISSSGNRKAAVEATFVSLLPAVDNFSQGLQYMFVTKDSSIRPGMNFTAWIPQPNTQNTGFIIPESALAWHLGQSFIFIKIDDEHFVHRNINNPVKVAKGFFISESLKDDDEVVVVGTQMLLSHEFRSQIPDEDDD